MVNEGCVTLKAPFEGSNKLVVKNANTFDQSVIGGYCNSTFSSDFYFVEARPTAIGEIQAGEGRGEAEIYDLSGRKVKNASSGLYIVNGKKVLVK